MFSNIRSNDQILWALEQLPRERMHTLYNTGRMIRNAYIGPLAKEVEWLTDSDFFFDFRFSIIDFRFSIIDFRFSIFPMVVDFRFLFSIFDFDFDFRFRIRFWLWFSISILTFYALFKKFPVLIYNFSDDCQSFSQCFQRFK